MPIDYPRGTKIFSVISLQQQILWLHEEYSVGPERETIKVNSAILLLRFLCVYERQLNGHS